MAVDAGGCNAFDSMPVDNIEGSAAMEVQVQVLVPLDALYRAHKTIEAYIYTMLICLLDYIPEFHMIE